MPLAVAIKRGQRFGQLQVIREMVARRDPKRREFEFRCDCGKRVARQLISVTTGHTRSCGCLTAGNNRTHGKSKTPTYKIWRGMLTRCRNPNDKSYVNYGGRGIKVCKRWERFENFLADMGERPSDKHEIDRIDNDGNYEPGNVRWIADGRAQTRNRRKQKGATSRFRGVDWWNGCAWRARITVNGKVRDLGLFDDEQEAALAYDREASRHAGYRLNFQSGHERT